MVSRYFIVAGATDVDSLTKAFCYNTVKCTHKDMKYRQGSLVLGLHRSLQSRKNCTITELGQCRSVLRLRSNVSHDKVWQ